MGCGLPVETAPRLRWLSYSVWPTVHSSSSALRWTQLGSWPSYVCQPSPPLIWWLCGWGHSVERSSSTMQALGPQKSASQQNSSTTPSQLWNTITFHAQIQAQQFSTGLGYGGVAGISESDWVSSSFSSNSRMQSFKCSSADILWAIEYPLVVVTTREGDPNFWRELL